MAQRQKVWLQNRLIVGSIPTRGHNLYFHFIALARRWVQPLNTQCLQNLAESGERSVLTLGSLYLPCCVRDTAWSWFIYLFILCIKTFLASRYIPHTVGWAERSWVSSFPFSSEIRRHYALPVYQREDTEIKIFNFVKWDSSPQPVACVYSRTFVLLGHEWPQAQFLNTV